MGIGVTVAFALNQLHPVYFTRMSLSKAMPFPVLGAISMILSPGARVNRRANAFAWGGACLALVFSWVVAVASAGQASAWLRALTGGVAQ